MKYNRATWFGVLVAGLCLAILDLRAETVIYQESARSTTAGNGFTWSSRSRTFLIWDTTSDQLIPLIQADEIPLVGIKYYSIATNQSRYQVVRGIAGKKGSETVFFRTTFATNHSGQFTAFSYFARGRDAMIDLSDGVTVALPRAMKATTRSLDNVLGPPYLRESVAVLQLQREDTRVANLQQESLTETIERIVARLEIQGYERRPN